MAVVRVAKPEEVTGKAKEILDEVEKSRQESNIPFGGAGYSLLALAGRPEYLEAFWKKYKEAFGPGKLDLRTKEIIAAVVSIMNNCSP